VLRAAAEHQAVADFYTSSFNNPDRVWKVRSRADHTEAALKLLTQPSAALPVWEPSST
jgi:hypothetical protein